MNVNMKGFFKLISAACKSSANEQSKQKQSFQDHWKPILSWLSYDKLQVQ